MKKHTKRVLLYSPYLDTLGGGERHILSVLKEFEKKNYSIDIAWDDVSIKKDISSKLNVKFKDMTIIPNFIRHSGAVDRFNKTKEYEYLFYVSDGSHFISGAKKNYTFIMVPQKSLVKSSIFHTLKSHNFKIIANGDYTAEHVQSWTRKKVDVIHPYIPNQFFSKKEKREKIILSVGRFFKHIHSKRQDVLIKAFEQLQEQSEEFRNYKLVLVGGLNKEDNGYYRELLKLAKGHSAVTIEPNISFTKLLNYYHTSEIYWHAAGYEVDDARHPEKVEHLGITPLEAMAGGNLVFCHNSGGPKKLFTDGKNAYLYSTIGELVTKTIEGKRKLDHSSNMIIKSQEFVKAHFSEKVFKEKITQYFNL